MTCANYVTPVSAMVTPVLVVDETGDLKKGA